MTVTVCLSTNKATKQRYLVFAFSSFSSLVVIGGGWEGGRLAAPHRSSGRTSYY